MGLELIQSGPPWRRLACWLGLLLLAAALIQGFCALRAAVPALDAVRFVALAERAGSESCWTLWTATGEEPLFPFWLRAVRGTAARISGGMPVNWATCVQLAAAIPAALSVVPVFLLSVRLVGERGAVAGTFLFCTLPVVVRLGAQGLSEGLFLFLFAFAAWTAVQYFQTHRSWWLAAAAVFSALATMTRIEGAALVLVLVPMVLIENLSLGSDFSASAKWRRVSHRLLSAAAVLCLFCLFLLPFRFASGSAPQTAESTHGPQLEGESVAHSFAVKEKSLRNRGVIAGGRQFAEEFAKAWNYIGLVGLGVGYWLLRGNSRGGERFIHAFWLFFGGILLIFAIWEGYLAARHLLPMVATGAGCAAIGLLHIGNRPAWGLFVIAVLFGLLRTAEPLHAERAGYRFAGRWLAEQSGGAKVLDTKGWTRLYSGRTTYQYDKAKEAFADTDLGFVVVDPRELTYDSPRSRTLSGLLARRGEKLAEFPPLAPRVAVYRWNPGTDQDEKPNRLFF